MTRPNPDTPMDVADPGLNPQLQAAMNLVELATPVVVAMTNIRNQYIAHGWDPLQAQKATLLLWQSSMAAVQQPDTP